MAERYVWTDDLAALGETTRSQLRSIAATRANLRMEQNMSLIKRRPLLAAAIAALVIAIAAPVAWAIGTKIFVSIDPEQSADQIQHSVQTQLDNAGVPATVEASKDDGKLKLKIMSHDPAAGSNLAISIAGSAAPVDSFQVRLEVQAMLTPAQVERLQTAMSSPAISDAESSGDADTIEEAVTDALVAAGFKAADVQVTDKTLSVTITQPPAP
ncbi:MAG TPA: hypothetical protein VGG28_16270 [Kofleriaceae bacterium]